MLIAQTVAYLERKSHMKFEFLGDIRRVDE
jgi:hypothetical protein